ncbi:MAG: hypothetical protein ACPGPF_02060 [Pontibacterium sp.]
MKRLANSIFLVLVVGFSALYSSIGWSQECYTCDVQPAFEIEGCTDVGDCHSCGDDLDKDDFDDQFCVRAYSTSELTELTDYYNRCRVERNVTKYKSFSDFLAHGKCKGGILGDSSYTPRDFLTERLKLLKFATFYKELIKKSYYESKDTGFDKLKDVMHMMNTPNEKGETLLDFMYRVWHSDETDSLEARMQILHQMACKFGAKYNKYPNRNEDCKKRQDPRFMKI